MPIHIVQQGECLSQIAHHYGFASWKKLYDHPDNADLRKQRPDPNVLFPGDRVVIPERAPKQLSLSTDATHRLMVRKAVKVLRLELLAADGSPLDDAPYELTVSGIEPLQGTTDADGRLEHEVPITATTARLQILDRTLELRLRSLNPMKDTPDEGITGAQARLRNLGYAPGPADGKAGPRTRTAIAIFQADASLPISGELDDATIAALEDQHGC